MKLNLESIIKRSHKDISADKRKFLKALDKRGLISDAMEAVDMKHRNLHWRWRNGDEKFNDDFLCICKSHAVARLAELGMGEADCSSPQIRALEKWLPYLDPDFRDSSKIEHDIPQTLSINVAKQSTADAFDKAVNKGNKE